MSEKANILVENYENLKTLAATAKDEEIQIKVKVKKWNERGHSPFVSF